MKSTIEYLDAVAARLGGVSDYRVAMTLGISTAAVSKWRTGKDSIGDDAAIKIAAILGVELAEIVMTSRIERTQNAAVRMALENAIRKLGGAAAALALSIVALFSSSFVSGGAYAAVKAETVPLCILCKVIRRRCRVIISRAAETMTNCLFWRFWAW